MVQNDYNIFILYMFAQFWSGCLKLRDQMFSENLIKFKHFGT